MTARRLSFPKLTLVAIFASALIWISGTSLDHWDTWLLILSIALACLIPPLNDIRHKRFDLLNIRHGFIIFFALTYCVWPGFLLFGAKTYIPEVLQRHNFDYALFLAFLAIISYQVGYHSRLSNFLASKLPANSASAAWDVHRTHIVSTLLVGLSLVGFGILAHAAGGLSALTTNLFAFRVSGQMDGFGPAVELLYMCPVAFLLQHVLYRCQRRGLTAADPGIGTSSAVLFGLSVILALAGAARPAAMWVTLYLIIVLHYTGKPIRFSLRRLAAGLALLTILVTYADFRLPRNSRPTFDQTLQATISDLNTSRFWSLYLDQTFGRFHGGELLARIVSLTPQYVPHSYGLPMLEHLGTLLIPRSIWPDKPLPVPQVMNRKFYADLMLQTDAGSPGTPAVGEMYWYFGIPGVILGMWLLGMWSATVYKYLRMRRTAASLCLYAITWWFIFWCNESLTTYVSEYLLALTLLSCVLLTISRRTHASSLSAPAAAPFRAAWERS